MLLRAQRVQSGLHMSAGGWVEITPTSQQPASPQTQCARVLVSLKGTAKKAGRQSRSVHVFDDKADFVVERPNPPEENAHEAVACIDPLRVAWSTVTGPGGICWNKKTQSQWPNHNAVEEFPELNINHVPCVDDNASETEIPLHTPPILCAFLALLEASPTALGFTTLSALLPASSK